MTKKYRFSFKDNIKKSIIDDFVEKYTVDADSEYHVAECVRNMTFDEQLDLFKEKLFALLKFAYKNDMRITLCRSKLTSEPYDFTEFSIEVPNSLTNLQIELDDGSIDDDPLVEILFTINKINADSFIPTVDNFGNKMTRVGSIEIWVSHDNFEWASVGLEADGVNKLLNTYDSRAADNIVEEDMVLPEDVCRAIENILKELHKAIKKDPKWYSWFILQGIDIDEVFLWKLSE